MTKGVLKPTHIQLALNLPTPPEIHDGLQTAMRLGWDTSTFKTFVANRVEQIARAKEKAALTGSTPVIPTADPVQLTQYKQCLICGYTKDGSKIVMLNCCEGCRTLAKYVTDQLGASDDCLPIVYEAMKLYFSVREPTPGAPNIVKSRSIV